MFFSPMHVAPTTENVRSANVGATMVAVINHSRFRFPLHRAEIKLIERAAREKLLRTVPDLSRLSTPRAMASFCPRRADRFHPFADRADSLVWMTRSVSSQDSPILTCVEKSDTLTAHGRGDDIVFFGNRCKGIQESTHDQFRMPFDQSGRHG